MITDSLIRKKFVHETMTEGMNTIFSKQQSVLSTSGIEVRTGRLQSQISGRRFDRQISDGRYQVMIPMYAHMRFLDMSYRLHTGKQRKARRERYALYNKVVWGVLFHEVFPELRYGFTDEVRQSLRQQLQSALQPK